MVETQIEYGLTEQNTHGVSEKEEYQNLMLNQLKATLPPKEAEVLAHYQNVSQRTNFFDEKDKPQSIDRLQDLLVSKEDRGTKRGYDLNKVFLGYEGRYLMQKRKDAENDNRQFDIKLFSLFYPNDPVVGQLRTLNQSASSDQQTQEFEALKQQLVTRLRNTVHGLIAIIDAGFTYPNTIEALLNVEEANTRLHRQEKQAGASNPSVDHFIYGQDLDGAQLANNLENLIKRINDKMRNEVRIWAESELMMEADKENLNGKLSAFITAPSKDTALTLVAQFRELGTQTVKRARAIVEDPQYTPFRQDADVKPLQEWVNGGKWLMIPPTTAKIIDRVETARHLAESGKFRNKATALLQMRGDQNEQLALPRERRKISQLLDIIERNEDGASEQAKHELAKILSDLEHAIYSRGQKSGNELSAARRADTDRLEIELAREETENITRILNRITEKKQFFDNAHPQGVTPVLWQEITSRLSKLITNLATADALSSQQTREMEFYYLNPTDFNARRQFSYSLAPVVPDYPTIREFDKCYHFQDIFALLQEMGYSGNIQTLSRELDNSRELDWRNFPQVERQEGLDHIVYKSRVTFVIHQKIDNTHFLTIFLNQKQGTSSQTEYRAHSVYVSSLGYMNSTFSQSGFNFNPLTGKTVDNKL